MNKKVFVSGCYDMLHSGHVAFFEEASRLGDLYVGLGSDATIAQLKNRQTVNSDAERLYMVKAIRYVKDAWINSGSGLMDFEKEVLALKPDIFFVNSDGFSQAKADFCQAHGIELVVSQRIPSPGLPARSTTAIRQSLGKLAAVGALLLSLGATASPRTVDIRDCGALPTATPPTNATAIQKAIDTVADAGGGTVVVPPGEWVSGTIWLKSGVELHLEKEAVLKASPNFSDYNREDAYPENFGCPKSEYWRGLHFIICRAAERVSITGEGTIHGNGDVFFDEKPIRYFDWMTPDSDAWWNGIRWAKDKVNLRPGQLVVFVKCRHLLVEGVTIRNSPCWSLFFHGCEDVTVRRYTVRNGPDDGNADGVDVDCCRNVLLEDLDIETGDDAIAIRGSGRRLGLTPQPPCENVVVRRAKLDSSSSVFRIGVGDGLIRNVSVEDVVSKRGGTAINIRSHYGDLEKTGVDMENIVFRRCRFDNCRRSYEIATGGKRLTFGIRNVVFEDVVFPPNVPSRVGERGYDPKPENILIR